MRKVIKIRLYRVQDYDLYTLYYDPVFALGDAMRLAITAFAEGRPTPRIDVGYVQELPMRKPISIVMTVVLNSEPAIRMMEAASAHSRNANNLAKNLLRRSLVGIERIYFEPEAAPLYAGRDILSITPPERPVPAPVFHPEPEIRKKSEKKRTEAPVSSPQPEPKQQGQETTAGKEIPEPLEETARREEPERSGREQKQTVQPAAPPVPAEPSVPEKGTPGPALPTEKDSGDDIDDVFNKRREDDDGMDMLDFIDGLMDGLT